jgi:hypothetical protein
MVTVGVAVVVAVVVAVAVGGTAVKVTQAENSDVFPLGSVAVAVMTSPGEPPLIVAWKEPPPAEFVITKAVVSYLSPSPWPADAQLLLR